MFTPTRGWAVAGLITAGALALTGCSSSDSLSGASSSSDAKQKIVVGSANFSENTILADIYGQALAANGFTVSYKPNIGARAVYFPALTKGQVDVIPEYSGSILSFLDKSAVATSPDDVNAALAKALPSTVVALTPAEAADADSLNVTADYAKANNLTSIEDLKNIDSFVLAANPEFETRPDGIPALKSLYGLDNFTFQAINDSGGPATLKALLDNTVQVADIYSTTPSIEANKLVTLTDPKNEFASQQVVPVVYKKKTSAKLESVLNKVSAKLTTKDLLSLNAEVSGDSKTQPDVAAKNWLKKVGLVK
ncbi:MAG TPA: ABC transporter substrate-binding protein [Lacisediminihabitans sp.]|uniref:ABC transporter substrate-binding protein n=1 Tax=Lacisediminihabitans sp. TaxID=2787631 RepID=UPI002ED839EE